MKVLGSFSSLIGFAAVASLMATMIVSVPDASAQLGPVTISGVRYVDGEPSKVKCAAKEGNILDASNFGTRSFFLQPDSQCAITLDTSADSALKFTGPENEITKQGDATGDFIFGGVPTGTGPAIGAAAGVLKCKRGCKSDTGTITYSYTIPDGPDIIFNGKYKATF